MKFGINTLLWTASFDRQHLDLIPKARAGGFDAIEVARFDFTGFPAAEVRRAAEQEGMGTIFCSALTGRQSLVSDDPDVRRETREFIKDGIKVTAEIGAKTFIGPYCSAVGLLPGRRRTEDEWKRCVEELQGLVPTLKEYDVSIALEPLNRFETYFLNTAADAAKLCDEVGDGHVGILGDTFHFNIEEKSIPNAYRICGRHLKHVHTCENDRGIPGSGHVDWAGVMAALHELKFDGYVSIESFGSAIKEIAAAACIWRDLAPSSEAIAFDGVAFLKKAAA
jgi:D-psicose/D-tagatose/L-ribulose 3-epimerase